MTSTERVASLSPRSGVVGVISSRKLNESASITLWLCTLNLSAPDWMGRSRLPLSR